MLGFLDLDLNGEYFESKADYKDCPMSADWVIQPFMFALPKDASNDAVWIGSNNVYGKNHATSKGRM